MNSNAYNETALKKYLLGEFSGKELDELERGYLADSDLFERLLVVEDDLLDQYARGELSVTEQQQFERQLLATQRQRESLMNARVLLAAARAKTSGPVRSEQFIRDKWTWGPGVLGRRRTLAFATLFLLVVTALIAIRVWQRNSELKRIQAEIKLQQEKQPKLPTTLEAQQSEEKQQLPKQADSPVISPRTERAPQVATFVLPITLTRSSGLATTFVLKTGVETVRLQAQIADGDYKTYQAELRSADGDHIRSFAGVKPQHVPNADLLSFNITAKLLTRSDYILKISGIGKDGRPEDAAVFSFRITKE